MCLVPKSSLTNFMPPADTSLSWDEKWTWETLVGGLYTMVDLEYTSVSYVGSDS